MIFRRTTISVGDAPSPHPSSELAFNAQYRILLNEWLDIPSERPSRLIVAFNTVLLPVFWLTWVNKALLVCDPMTLRNRIASQINTLGSIAALFIVIAVAALLVPPMSRVSGERTFHFSMQ